MSDGQLLLLEKSPWQQAVGDRQLFLEHWQNLNSALVIELD